jgi:transcription factor E
MAKKNHKVLKSGSKKGLAAKKSRKAGKISVSVSKKANKKVIRKEKVSKGAKAPRKIKKEEPQPIVENKDISFAVGNRLFADYVNKNVGRRAMEIVESLNDAPQTDDKLSAKLDLKVNEIRRMLNVLNSYSITRYDINKDNKGWLTFRWYLDREKLKVFVDALEKNSNTTGPHLQENCNDFFFCKGCYDEQKVIFPFDTAFESNFKCGECGKPLSALNREETQVLVYQSRA